MMKFWDKGKLTIEREGFFPRPPRFWGKLGWFQAGLGFGWSGRIFLTAQVVIFGVGFWFEMGYGE